LKFKSAKHTFSYQVIAFILCQVILSFSSFAQSPASYSPHTTRILFVLDASGSMKSLWQGTSKFDLSKEILISTIDSISKTNTKVEFALRVMGHQFPRAANNCKDSKLEVPFSKNNLPQIRKQLQEIRAQGQTPITYALSQAVNDFPADSTARNAIVIITDGNETCGGNICDIALQMQEKGIVLKPFIVGLGLTDSVKKKFECAGLFYDVQNETMFNEVMKVVVSRVLNATTAQVNLLDGLGVPSETNVSMTFYQHNSGSVKYNCIHTLNAKGNPDTLLLDPKVEYDLTVHTVPAVMKKGIELVPGIHNTIALDVPQGTLEIKQDAGSGAPVNIPCLIRQGGSNEILYVQDVNRSLKYLVGNYDLEVLTLPVIKMNNIKIEDRKITSIKIPRTGTLTVTPSEPGVASVFLQEGNKLEKVFDYYKITASKSISLQPGNYIVIFRPEKGRQSAKTKQYSIQVNAAKTSSVRL
jgi:Ca-activated chloride channel family protein